MKLILLRHGESVGTVNNLFDGWYDSEISEIGIENTIRIAQKLKEVEFHPTVVYTSVLSRAIQTVYYLLKELDLLYLDVIKDWHLNARNCGKLEGLSKMLMEEKYSKEQVFQWRNNFNLRPPENLDRTFDQRYARVNPQKLLPAESFSDAYHRVVPYFKESVEPRLMRGEDIIIVAHTHSIRSLIKYIEEISDNDIENVIVEPVQATIYEYSETFELIDIKILLP